MEPNSAELILTYSFSLIVVIVIFVVYGIVRYKLGKFSHSMFNTKSFMDGVRQQREIMNETPRSLHSMTSIYLPMIQNDFPEFDYPMYRDKAQSLLRSYFNAVSTKSTSVLSEECSLTLKNNVQSIIYDLNSRNVTQMFVNTVIHDVQIARYIKDGKTATIVFEISVGHYAYIVDSTGAVVFGDKGMKKQTIYEVGLMYVQDADKIALRGEALGVNCPNCGAPVTNLGEKFCKYCGTAVIEVNTRAWKFNSVQEQTVQGRQY